jgi:hypothetical protein
MENNAPPIGRSIGLAIGRLAARRLHREAAFSNPALKIKALAVLAIHMDGDFAQFGIVRFSTGPSLTPRAKFQV